MTEAEYREHVRAALLEGLLSFNGAAINEETKQAMMDKVIEVWPPRPPIKWVESVKIEDGTAHYTLTQEAIELLRDDPPIYCGLGCQCVTQCGDFYDFHGYPKPPENEEFVDAARKAGERGAATP